MSLPRDALQHAIEEILESLAGEKGMEWITKVRVILSANLDRNRLQKFTGGKPDAVADYARRVIGNYELLHPYLHQLQIERSNDHWTLLLKNLQKWSYRFLVRKGFPADASTWECAGERAHEAARSILNAHFPYDTGFEPWAQVVVQNACLKFMRSQGKDVPIVEESLEDLEETFQGFAASPFHTGDPQDQEYQELLEAIPQLSSLRRQVIEMKYFQGLSPLEIATKLGKNVRAVHSLQFHALQDLRKILAQNRNKINE